MKKSVVLFASLIVASLGASWASVPTDANDVRPLMVGQQIPSADVMTPDGAGADIAKVVGDKPSIVIFYRGGW